MRRAASLSTIFVLVTAACGGTEFSAADAPAGAGGAGGVQTGGAGQAGAGGAGQAGTSSAGQAGGGGAGQAGGGGAGQAGAGKAGAAGAGQGGASGAGQGGGGPGGAGGAGQAGAGGGPSESCMNGVDDDGDGAADCADTDCGTFRCAAAPGTTALGVGFIDQALDAPCPADFPTKVKLYDSTKVVASGVACACACGPAEDEACTSGLACGATCGVDNPATSLGGSCTPMGGLANGVSIACIAKKPVVSSSGCAPAPPPTIPPATWSPSQRACVRTQGGSCSNPDRICVPKPDGGAPLCLVLPGDVACPATAKTKTLYFDGKFVDTRACDTSGCACGAPEGGTCSCGSGCNVDVFTDSSCGALDTSFPPNSTTCKVMLPGATKISAQLVGASITKHAACAPKGATTLTGGVEPEGPLTVCCP